MRLHSLICRAEKPTVRESEESENDSSASPSRRPKRRRINGPPKGQMDDELTTHRKLFSRNATS